MTNRGLIFIPDISGFTKFVNEVEIDHSRHIIQELLEVVINANQIGLEISEIEGDAILFFKYGNPPGLEEIYAQVEKMFTAFHKHIKAYDHRKLCQCKACTGAIDLTLKVITHYGEFTGYNVKNFNKLIGKDIIVAHQLLKNDIEQHEYWLVTASLAGEKAPEGLPGPLEWNKCEKKTETGVIPYQYAQLSHLKNQLPSDLPVDYTIKERVKQFSFTGEYDTDIVALLHAAVDYHTRHKWRAGVKNVVEVSDPVLPRVGTRHKCILDKGASILYTSSYSFAPEHIVYGETDEKKQIAIDYIFDYITENKTRLTVEFYTKRNPFFNAVFKLFFKNKTEREFKESMEKLQDFIEATSDLATA